METEKELSAKIVDITLQIQEKYPELRKHLHGLPEEKDPNSNNQVLNEYYNSLNTLLKDYQEKQSSSTVLKTHPRPEPRRILDTPIQGYDLPEVIERLKNEEEWISGKHNAITLVKSEGVRIVLVAMHKGNEMKINHIEVSSSIHVVEGHLKVSTETNTHVFSGNQLIKLKENTKHELTATEDTAFLLTVVSFI